MSFRVGDRVVPTEEAQRTLFTGSRMRFPVVGKTIGTVTKTPGGGSFYGVEWDPDEVGPFPCSEWEPGQTYTKPQLEWLLSAAEMEKYVPTTTNTQQQNEIADFRRQAALVAVRAKRAHPGKTDDIDEILKVLGEAAPDPLREPARGSIVRHPTMSVVYIRPWARYSEGGPNWKSSNNSENNITWQEVLRACANNPVVLLSTVRGEGTDVEDYATADQRLGLKKLTEQSA